MRNVVIIVLALGVAAGAWFYFNQPHEPASLHTDKPVEAWARRLDADTLEDRYQAGLMLSQYGTAAVPTLVARLTRDVEKGADARGDPDAEGDPRQLAADTLVMIGRPAVAPLIEILTVDSHYERALAQQALVTIGLREEDLTTLLPLLSHDNPITAGMAGHLIGTLEGGGEALVHLLNTNADDETTVHRALLTISRIEGDDPECLTPYLSHPSPVVRREALHVLRLVGASADQTEVVAALLGDEDEQVQSWAAAVLRRMKADAQFALVAVARDGAPEAAQLAMGLIGELGPSALSAVPVLRERLDDPSALVRSAAAEAIHAITRVEDDVLPVLLQVVAAGDRAARIHAIAALGGFEENAGRVVTALRPLLGDADFELARVAAISLGNLGPGAKAAEGALEEAVASSNQALSRAAAMALQMIRTQEGD